MLKHKYIATDELHEVLNFYRFVFNFKFKNFNLHFMNGIKKMWKEVKKKPSITLRSCLLKKIRMSQVHIWKISITIPKYFYVSKTDKNYYF